MVKTDRRVFARFESRIPLRFKNLETGSGNEVIMRDIGGGGLKFLATQRLMHLNDPLELSIEPPEAQPVSIKGKVVWVKAAGQGLWDVGISFDKAKLVSLSRACSSLNVAIA